ncbi:MAG: MlaD family protein [bacterium]
MYSRLKSVASNTNKAILMATGILSFLIIAMLTVASARYILINAAEQAQLKFFIKFKETPPIHEDLLRRGIQVYYRGIKVGKVTNIDLSNDNSSVIYNITIYRKNLTFPKNIMPLLLLEDVIGNRYIDINYPQQPSAELLKNGATVNGLSPMIIKDLNLFFIKEFNSGKLESILNNVNALSSFASQNREKLTPVISYLNNVISDKNKMAQLLNTPQLIGETSQQIAITNNKLGSMSKQLTTTSSSINSADNNIKNTNYSIVKTQEHLAKTNNNFDRTNKNIETANNNLNDMNPQLKLANNNLCTINQKVPEIPKDLLTNADEILKKVKKFTDTTLGKLVFGKE